MEENHQTDIGFKVPVDSVAPLLKDLHIMENVNIVEDRRVLIPISSIENLQAMDLISTGLLAAGGITAGFSGFRIEFLPIGVIMVIAGLFLHYKMVRKILKSWIKHKGHKIIIF